MTPPRRSFARFRRPVRLLAFAACSLILSSPVRAQGARDVWSTDGTVYAVAPVGNVLYVGGSFSRIGPSTGSALLYDPTSGQPLLPAPQVAGTVSAVAPDGAGGWYIGGSFTSVQRQPRNNLAHLDASGNVTAWNPGADALVSSLVRAGTTIYIGGSFTQVGGMARASLAAVDTAGVVKAWSPVIFGGVVNCLAAKTAPTFALYAGGTFLEANNILRNRAAAFDSTGALLAWNPNASGIVYALAPSGATVYLGGSFTKLNGGLVTRNEIAAVDASTGAVTSWNPSMSGTVYALALGAGSIYAGGSFSTVGGQAHNDIAQIDATTALPTAWDPALNLNGYVYTLAVDGSTVYAGGRFTQVGDETRLHLAAIDATTGFATTWAPEPNDEVDAVGLGPTVFAGGQFTSNGGVARSNIAAIDLTTGHATAWDPGANNTVESLLPGPGVIYVGGEFGFIGGQPRSYLAAIRTATGAATNWAPNILGGGVHTMTAIGSTLYIGGTFSSVGGQSRSHLAAVDTSTAAPTGWHPATNGAVQTIVNSGGVAYVGGGFSTIGSGPLPTVGDSLRLDLAAVDAASGAILAWNPHPSANISPTVSVLALSGGELYVGGTYTTMGGQARANLSAVDPVTGLVTAWKPDPDGSVNALAVDGGVIYVGGAFTTIGTDAAHRNAIAALDPTTGATTTWDASANNAVNALATHAGLVCAGGTFTTMSNRPFGRLAVLTEATTDVRPAPPALAAQMGITPNPSRGAVLLSFRLAAPGAGEVALYDLRGRRVRVLVRGDFPAGEQHVGWDGRDASGRRMAPGSYFASVRVGAQRIGGHVIRLE